jgi:phospholipid/cholesterol/gamma-HCH transport system permease protein
MSSVLAEGRSPAIDISADGEGLAMAGVLDINTLPAAEQALQQRRKAPHSVDVRNLDRLDTPGALFLCGLRARGVELTGVRSEHKALLDLICGLDLKPLPKIPGVPRWREVISAIGKGCEDALLDARDIVTFIGRTANSTLAALVRPRGLHFASVSRQVAETGIDALPIVGLMAIMISVVIAYQSVTQLRSYGAENLTINLVAISMLREMGVLITAILVAGRSGSAFTAELGVMKAREEIDALKVMGLDPMRMLVVPRLVALVITLPLLTFFADVVGLFGGAMATQVLLKVAPMQFFEHARSAVDTHDLMVGLIKAPVFAVIIAVVGCMHGLRVRGSAESVGHETTRAVVKAIFLVIVLDALFSIVFEQVGW